VVDLAPGRWLVVIAMRGGDPQAESAFKPELTAVAEGMKIDPAPDCSWIGTR
jgi:hypothetical protein